MSLPMTLPDLAYSPVSSTGYLSPAESDAIQTPFLDASDNELPFKSNHIVDHDVKREKAVQLPNFAMECKPHVQISHPPPQYDYNAQVDDFLADSPLSESSSSHAPPGSSSYYSCPPDIHPTPYMLDACQYSEQFPEGHQLETQFACTYQLEDQLGSGGYGFVMTAKHRVTRFEVAVKFIIKDKVPDYAWVDDDQYGRLPTEVFLLDYMDHKNVVKGIDLFQDSLYYYLVQELHGSPWPKSVRKRHTKRKPSTVDSPLLSPPCLTPSISADSFDHSTPATPPLSHSHQPLPPLSQILQTRKPELDSELAMKRPNFGRRPSHDLFECIEQSAYKRLPEEQARYVFAQVVDAVHYLDSHGIAHRDIKDENIAIDQDLNVKLIDFGSSIFVDPSQPRPYYTLFYGTTAYAASEILLKQAYQAAPAEVWTLGVLLAYLLHGMSPFPSVKDAIRGRIILDERPRISRDAYDLMKRCLHPNPVARATIQEIKDHRWLAA